MSRQFTVEITDKQVDVNLFLEQLASAYLKQKKTGAATSVQCKNQYNQIIQEDDENNNEEVSL